MAFVGADLGHGLLGVASGVVKIGRLEIPAKT